TALLMMWLSSTTIRSGLNALTAFNICTVLDRSLQNEDTAPALMLSRVTFATLPGWSHAILASGTVVQFRAFLIFSKMLSVEPCNMRALTEASMNSGGCNTHVSAAVS